MLLSLGLIIPVIATEWNVSGDMRLRSFFKSNSTNDLNDDGASDAYYDFRFRPVFNIGISDDLSITTRVVVFDEKFGTNEEGRYVESGTINDASGKSDVASWDRAWTTLKTSYGTLDAGRMSGGLFGLSLFETESARDRIKWTTKVNDLILLGIIEKNAESVNSGDELSDSDTDAYYIAGIYNKNIENNNIEAGMLLGQIRAEESTGDTTTSYMLIDPYWDLAFKRQRGTFGFKGEVQYRTGSISNKDSSVGQDIDISAMGFYLAASYDFVGALEGFDVELGYANTSGDDEIADNEISSLGGLGVCYSGLGDEWTPLVILQDVNGLLDQGIVEGLVGGNSNSPFKTSTGVSLIYLIANYDLNKKIRLSAVFGTATPNAKIIDSSGNNTNKDDAFGNEFDLKLAWNITDNLAYNFNAGYLMAGDFFKAAGVTDPQNTYTIYQSLEISF